jgi:hypothetical protein
MNYYYEYFHLVPLGDRLGDSANKTAVILGIISVFHPSLARACTTDRNYRFGKLVAYDVIREI